MPTEPSSEQVRPLAAVLQEIDRGRLHQQGSDQIHQLLAACLATGKPGDITIKIHVKVTSAEERRLEVSGQVVTKLPQPAARTSIFFVDGDGNLTRNDPAQLQFDETPVRAVTTPVGRQA